MEKSIVIEKVCAFGFELDHDSWDTGKWLRFKLPNNSQQSLIIYDQKDNNWRGRVAVFFIKVGRNQVKREINTALTLED